MNINYNNVTEGIQIMKIEKIGIYIYIFAVKPIKINDNPIYKKWNKSKKGDENTSPEKI